MKSGRKLTLPTGGYALHVGDRGWSLIGWMLRGTQNAEFRHLRGCPNGFVSAFSVGTEYSDLFSGAVLIDRSDKRQYDKNKLNRGAGYSRLRENE